MSLGEQTAHDLPSQPGLDTPLRLEQAVKLAFPFGGMTVSGLRREAAKGRLIIERIAGKDFVTLRAINEMRVRCRDQQRTPDYGLNLKSATRKESSHGAQHGSLEMGRVKSARAALELTARGLNVRSPNISPENTQSRAIADVTLLKF
jgi:hypothetical protein